MSSTEQRLIDARSNLQDVRAYLSFLRTEGRETDLARRVVLRALDRLWEAQSMAEPRL